MSQFKTTTTRRSFIKSAAATSAALGTMGFHGIEAAESTDKVNFAIIGCTNRGAAIGNDAVRSGMVNVVALCDVDPERTAKFKKDHPDAKVYDDFRKMFDEMGDKLDACTVGTPDHTHFPITMRAIAEGVAVYVEKPLAHTFEECELLIAAEKKYNAVCQMGNQGHSSSQRLQFQAWVEDGFIKNVRRVDACMNKGRRWHPWGNVQGYPQAETMPASMNWDVWTGTAPLRDYSERLDLGNWRGWYDYGNGAFGDWGPHTLDTVHRFLKLGLPYEVRADKLEGPNQFIYPMATTIAFEFAERGPGMPAMSINWHDGVGNKPPQPEGLPKGKSVPACGKVIYSDDRTFLGGTHSAKLSVLTETESRDAPEVPHGTTNQNHMKNFLLAAMGKEECNSKFAVSGPLTQVFMLGCIAQRLGGTLKFDTETQQITNNETANQLLKGHEPRKGWEQYYTI
ncbi:Gfo/Idh/MocA family oxidoreductase [Rhodopirellula sp. JC740]|uniref:Gfo/Idh/MocA family oxidoreductase n=1 Tax=Rhodopirellula halodulae TaxID=2894198 RepID=A0ABS8NC77_9BACT|nr:Gfo/Idh/MocA family oxidoreductase [Rhodopirellula sp. JC740]MCC9641172.1 Gfo/Idh/MocA family oxidoreductase [Rhodopirellula sp. JC740]